MKKEIKNQVAGLFSSFSIPTETPISGIETPMDANKESLPEQEENEPKRKKVKICSVISEDILSKTKALSKKEGLQFCDILDAALHNLIKEYEAENGKLEPIQQKKNTRSLYH